jgi:hypothetical protein
MKNLALLFMALLLAVSIQAQSPQKFNYQGVARYNTGGVIPNQNISIQVSILDGSPNGSSQYTEHHSVTTSQLGLFTLSIGGGAVILGSFADITWNSGDKYLKVEMDPAGGNNYVLAGTTQLLSVPYALQSRNTSRIQGNPIASTPPSDGQVLTWDGAAWIPETPGAQAGSWLLTGNAGTDTTTNFIGTTDKQPLVFKVNN